MNYRPPVEIKHTNTYLELIYSLAKEYIREGKEVGLVIKTRKTKVMRNSFAPQDPIYLDRLPLENVEEYYI